MSPLALVLLLAALPHSAMSESVVSSSPVLRIAAADRSSATFGGARSLADMYNWRHLAGREFMLENKTLAVAVASGGAVANLADLSAARTELALVRADIADAAYQNPEQFGLDKNINRIRLVATHKPEFLHIVVRNDFAGTTVADLADKRVSTAAIGASTLFQLNEMLQAQGTSTSKLQQYHIPLRESFERLRRGQLDAVVYFDQTPSGLVVEGLASGELRLLSLDHEALQQFQSTPAGALVQASRAATFYSGADDVLALQLPTYLLAQSYVSVADTEVLLDNLNVVVNDEQQAEQNQTAGSPGHSTAFVVDDKLSPIPLHAGSQLLLDIFSDVVPEPPSTRNVSEVNQ